MSASRNKHDYSIVCVIFFFHLLPPVLDIREKEFFCVCNWLDMCSLQAAYAALSQALFANVWSKYVEVQVLKIMSINCNKFIY